MGMFDRLFGGMSANKDFNPPEAFAGFLLGAIAADGHITSEEAHGLWTITERMKLYRDWSADKFNAMMDKLLTTLKREGLDGLLERSHKALPEELRETVFANADLVLADGTVEDEEKEFLEKIARTLDIPGDTALNFIEVMIVKNRG